MKTINYTMLRSDMKKYMDMVIDEKEIVSVKRKNESVILLSENQYNILKRQENKVKESIGIYNVNPINIDMDLMNEANVVLSKLSIPMGNAIEMFLRQVVLKQGIPFEITLSNDASKMTRDELHALFKQGLDEADSDQSIDFETVKDTFEKKYGLSD